MAHGSPDRVRRGKQSEEVGSVTRRIAALQAKGRMATSSHSDSPLILLRVSDGAFHTHRSFNDFFQATQSAEAYAGAGFSVAMISATGRYLMGFEPRHQKVAV
jgi:hypothetical protein